MRVIKLKKSKGSPSLAVRLGFVNTPEQTKQYLLQLKAAKAELARAKNAKVAAGKKRKAA